MLVVKEAPKVQILTSSLFSVRVGRIINNPHYVLTHWDRVTHICVGKLAIIGLDNGLSPGRRQAIIWTDSGIVLIGPLRNKLQWNFIRHSYSFIKENALKNVVFEMASILSRPQCVNDYFCWFVWPISFRVTWQALPLQWRHNEPEAVSNHQPCDCLHKRLFRRRSEKTPKASHHWPLCGEFTGDRRIPRTKGK